MSRISIALALALAALLFSVVTIVPTAAYAEDILEPPVCGETCVSGDFTCKDDSLCEQGSCVCPFSDCVDGSCGVAREVVEPTDAQFIGDVSRQPLRNQQPPEGALLEPGTSTSSQGAIRQIPGAGEVPNPIPTGPPPGANLTLHDCRDAYTHCLAFQEGATVYDEVKIHYGDCFDMSSECLLECVAVCDSLDLVEEAAACQAHHYQKCTIPKKEQELAMEKKNDELRRGPSEIHIHQVQKLPGRMGDYVKNYPVTGMDDPNQK